MRGLYIKIAGLFTQVTSYAQDYNEGGFQNNNFQTTEEQQRIREWRLLEWHAQEQQMQQGEQYVEDQSQYHQSEAQNVSFNQPQQAKPAAVSPEREDLFNAANAGNVPQITKLLSQGINVNVTNYERETALHMAAARGHF